MTQYALMHTYNETSYRWRIRKEEISFGLDGHGTATSTYKICPRATTGHDGSSLVGGLKLQVMFSDERGNRTWCTVLQLWDGCGFLG